MKIPELVDKLTAYSFFDGVLRLISNKEKSTHQINISPLYGSSKSLFIKELCAVENQIVILLPDDKSAAELKVELDIINTNTGHILINNFQTDSIQEKLTLIGSREKFILISTCQILSAHLPDKEELEKKTSKIEVGGSLTYDDLLEYLNLLEYQKDKFVEAPGEYSQRGSIIDFWSYSEKNPVRLEFDGDFLESIRYFGPESQRSIEQVVSATLAGRLNGDGSNPAESVSSTIFDYLNNPVVIASKYELDNFGISPHNSLKTTGTTIDINDSITGSEKSEPPEPVNIENENIPAEITVQTENIFDSNARWVLEEEISSSADRINLGLFEPPTINGNYEILFNTLKDFSSLSYDVIITSENELQSIRLRDLLSEFNDEINELISSGKVKIETLAIKDGFLHKEKKLLLLTDYQIFSKPYRTKAPSGKKYKKSKSKAFASIKRGNYVVHEDYGIGMYAGLETIKIGETKQETMKLLYNEGGIVYVNLNYLNLVKKYSSNENLKPNLSTLGTNDWTNTKRKTKKKIKEAARELIELYAKRKAVKGFQFGADTVWQKELEASFMYEDTPDQEKVTTDVKFDMEAENPMDRLVCGDVGFGKTEIAVRAAFKAVQEGKQVALLVPTTILAEQHYNTFKDRLTQFPVKVAVMSRFQTKKEQNLTLQGLEQGTVDVVIGTHRLLSKDIKFKDIGLLIIDEEHRFGVTAKEKLRSLKVNVDTLTLTATPIPRTLNLSLLGARDLSIIATPPPNRQPIITHVSTFDILKIKEWILNELKRGGQVYFVHDRVQSIDKLSDYLNKHIPDIRIGTAHGQMRPSQLEDVIHGFLNKKYDLLLSTKIIESGIDIPNVNTIIVNRADRFGLAELHQLRGRVGRSNRQAYAYFIVPSLSGITKKALRRLQAIEEFTDIGAGFNLSMRDLEIRGAGNLLGKEQTGFINEIGFDLYLKMIDEAVEELKYKEFKEVFKSLPQQEERTEPTLDTYFELGIPETYMPMQTDRLNFYTALYSIKELNELDDLIEEMKDRFGPIPSVVYRLVLAAELRYHASFALFERLIMQRENISIILPKGENEDYYKFQFVEMMRFILEEYKNRIKLGQKKEIMKLIIKNKFSNPNELLLFLIKFSNQVAKLFAKEKSVEVTSDQNKLLIDKQDKK
ncbi:transcription-repair-coupling factor [bacterium BMS3Abin03]|nr:transcription-repair-coupling factor [bacterium BMS3Abin03]